MNKNGNTGTWSGPAPRGYLGPEGKNAPPPCREIREAAPAAPPCAVLPGGAKLPLMGLDTKGASEDVIDEALDKGYKHLDCDPLNGNEEAVGLAIKSGTALRSELFVSSTLPARGWNLLPQPHTEGVMAACQSSLASLGLDYLDLYWLPPLEGAPDLLGLWAAMEALVDAGLVRHLGLAHLTLPQIEKIRENCRIKPACLKVELHPLCAQRKLVGVCKRYGLALLAASPLPADQPQHKVIGEVAQACGHSASQVALRWNLQRCVGVLAPGNNTTQVLDSYDALSFTLLDSEKRQIDAIDENRQFATVSFATVSDPEEGGATKPSVVLGYYKN